MSPQDKKSKFCPECGSVVRSEDLLKHLETKHKVVLANDEYLENTDLGKSDRRMKMKQDRNRKRMMTFFVLAILVFVGYGIYYLAYEDEAGCCPPDKEPTEDEPDILGDLVSVPLSNVTTDAKFYPYDSNGTTIKFFIVKGANGNVHVAFDACEICHKAKKGYRQNGDKMHCIECGMEFSINGIGTENTKEDGCWPKYLPFEIDGEMIRIKVTDLEARIYMFE